MHRLKTYIKKKYRATYSEARKVSNHVQRKTLQILTPEFILI